MRASTLVADLLSAAVLLSLNTLGLASRDGALQRVRGMAGNAHHEEVAAHQRDQDPYTDPYEPYGYQPPHPTSSAVMSSSGIGKRMIFKVLPRNGRCLTYESNNSLQQLGNCIGLYSIFIHVYLVHIVNRGLWK